ncbi:54S ribosomal protein L24, mitochondrial [Phlyctema vagabunda]|uniref:54S ribosomal protein L24, mitochondrial n=1 Tax=Phlyctema vagabunda TaxID=108571 RepID=A0ABR4PEW1_9HELO
MPLLPPSHPSLSHIRTFTSTGALLAKSTKQRLAFEHSAIPPYPYGSSQWYKQSNFGLYGLQKIRYGNMVSEKNEIKTRRYWRPNVQRKFLYSAALGKKIRTRVTTRVLRTMDKCGGLDNYLLGDKAQRIKELGMGGWKLRWRIMQTDVVKERFRLERAALGLPPKEEVLLGADGQVVTSEMVRQEVLKFDESLTEETEVGIGEELEDESTADVDFMAEESAKAAKEKELY